MNKKSLKVQNYFNIIIAFTYSNSLGGNYYLLHLANKDFFRFPLIS